jgi:hypothetical protein
VKSGVSRIERMQIDLGIALNWLAEEFMAQSLSTARAGSATSRNGFLFSETLDGLSKEARP